MRKTVFTRQRDSLPRLCFSLFDKALAYQNKPRLSLLLTVSTCLLPVSMLRPPFCRNCWIMDITAGLESTLIESATFGFFSCGNVLLRCGKRGSRSSRANTGFAFSAAFGVVTVLRGPNRILPRLWPPLGRELSFPSVLFISCSSCRT